MKSFFELFGVCSLLVAIVGCGGDGGAHKALPEYSVSRPLRQDANLLREHVCQIRAIRHIEMRGLARGYLEKVHVDEGQAVKEGQLLFEIMPRLYQAEVGKAQAEAEFAEIEFRNTEQLAKTKIVAQSELALNKAKYDKARAELVLEQIHLDFTQLKAPFDGIVGKFNIRPGGLVDEGDLLTTLSDNHEMWVYFNVPEAEYLQYKRKGMQENMPVQLVMADNSTYDHVGKVTAIEADFNNETGNIAFRATFPNPDGILRHGATGKILVNSVVKDAMLVPQTAVFEILDKRFVYTADESGKVSQKEIKVSAQVPDLFVVASGISDTDQILLEGQRKVRDGDSIVPKPQDPVQVAKNLKVYAE